MEVLVGKPDMVVVLPENGCHDGALHRMAHIGSDELVAVVPTIEVIRGNRAEPVVKEGPAQCIASLRFLHDPYGLFHDEIEPPVSEQGSPMDAAAVICLRQSRRRPVGSDDRCNLICGW